MRFALTVLMSTALLAAAEPQAKKKAAPAAPPKRVEIPAEAVEREPGRFFYTDKDGKKWIFVRTPFGISKGEDRGGAPAPRQAGQAFDNVKVTEADDTVTFERPTPFGVSKWTKKKADLNEDEKATLLRSQQASAKQDR